MNTSWIWLIAIGALLSGMALVAKTLPRLPRVLIVTQVLYWSIAYILRPIILLIVKPTAALNDSIADPRLAIDGYSSTLQGVLSIVALGLSFYFIALILYRNYLKRAQIRLLPSLNDSPQMWRVLTICTMIGWASRLVQIAVLPDNSLLDLMQYLASAGVVGLLILIPSVLREHRIPFCLLLLLSEFAWSLLTASKTPILGALLALAIGLLSSTSTRKNFLAVVAIGVASFGLFQVIQNIKTSIFRVELSGVDAVYPWYIRPFLSLTRRFDMLSAVTDAYSFGPKSWVHGWSFLSLALSVIVPAPLQSGDKPNLGQLWASEVRAFSLPGSNIDVSLASGSIAEGWVTGGVLGLVIQAVALIFVLHITYMFLTSRRPWLFSFGVLLIAYPTLFERGLLGNLALISKAAQVAVVIFLISLLNPIFSCRGKNKYDQMETSPICPSK